MSAEIAQTPEARRAAAEIAVKQREDAIRANAIKQGREAERKDHAEGLAKREGEHAGEIAGIKQAHADELKRAIRAHEKGALWLGVSLGGAIGAVFVSAITWLLVDRAMQSAFDKAQEIAAASTLVGAATQRRN